MLMQKSEEEKEYNMQKSKEEEEEEYAQRKERLQGTSWQVFSIIFLLLIPNVASVVPLLPLQQITM